MDLVKPTRLPVQKPHLTMVWGMWVCYSLEPADGQTDGYPRLAHGAGYTLSEAASEWELDRGIDTK